MLSEKLFQFIWQFKYFDFNNITSLDNEAIEIIHVGYLNKGQGPDFLNAKIRIGDKLWAGHVELHLKDEDWIKHKHHTDKNYNNVILHVLFYKPNVKTKTEIPTIYLENRIAKTILSKYSLLMQSSLSIPCQNLLSNVPELTITNWIDRLAAERLEIFTHRIYKIFEETENSWEQTLWILLARSFGLPNNSECFEAMAKTISIQLLAKHKQNLIQIESMLLGQANLLNNEIFDDYAKLLQKEYNYLKKIHNLKEQYIQPSFGRSRPANFPTLRLAQLASIIHHQKQLFRTIIECENYNDLFKLFAVLPNDYWLYHYHFSKQSTFKEKHIGKSFFELILINVIVPIVYAYGKYQQNNNLIKKAELWWQQAKAEKNSIVKIFNTNGIKTKSAFETQALVHLSKNYCTKKLCLECQFFNSIVRSNKV